MEAATGGPVTPAEGGVSAGGLEGSGVMLPMVGIGVGRTWCVRADEMD